MRDPSQASGLGGLLTEEDGRCVDSWDWTGRVRGGRGIWVNARAQRLLLIRNRCILRSYACSTSKVGLGNSPRSYRTPLGWQMIAERIGAGYPDGAILRGRAWTGQTWQPGDPMKEDLILGRILRLADPVEDLSLAPTTVTWKRMIYIHGTNAVNALGTRSSRGCIRLSPPDIVDLFELVPVGCPVLIG